MNIRGPFGDLVGGPFTRAAIESKDRPKVTHRGVRVMRHDEHDLTQVDEYPQATGWYVDDNGQLDVRNEDSAMHVVASYPRMQWRRVWFPGAEEKTRIELPLDVEEEEDENGEREDVEPNEG